MMPKTAIKIIHNNLIPFLVEVQQQPYVSNSGGGTRDRVQRRLHEIAIESLLISHNVPLIKVTGSPAADFRVELAPGLYIDLEAKSMADYGYPHYGDNLPREGVIYIFCSRHKSLGASGATMIFLGQDITTPAKRNLISELKVEIKKLVRTYKKRPGWNDEFGLHYSPRTRITHRGGNSACNYFSHRLRQRLENHVFERLTSITTDTTDLAAHMRERMDSHD